MKRIIVVAIFSILFCGGAAFAKMPKVLPLADVKPGTEAIGFSVFSGLDPEPFRVVLGKVVGGGENPMITARATSVSGEPLPSPLERSGILGGMSGSPVFVGCVTHKTCMEDGVLVGGLSAGPGSGFTLEGSNALITPAEQMLDGASQGYFAIDAMQREENQQIPRITYPAPEHCKNLVPSQADLVPGSMIEMTFAQGTLPVAASGTVTWRDGNRIWALGHPLLGVGNARIPFRQVYVADSIQTRAESFKLTGCPAGNEGVLTIDGTHEVSGIIGQHADLINVDMRVRVADTTFAFSEGVVRGIFSTELMLWGLPETWMLQTFGHLRDVTIIWQARMVFRDQPELFFSDMVIGNPQEIVLPRRILAPLVVALGVVKQSGFPYTIETINIDAEIRMPVAVWKKKGVSLSKPQAEPGDTVTLTIELQKFPGLERKFVEIPIHVPQDILTRKTPNHASPAAQTENLLVNFLGSVPIQIFVQDGARFVDKRTEKTSESLREAITRLRERVEKSSSVIYVQEVLPGTAPSGTPESAGGVSKPPTPQKQPPEVFFGEPYWKDVDGTSPATKHANGEVEVRLHEIPLPDGGGAANISEQLTLIVRAPQTSSPTQEKPQEKAGGGRWYKPWRWF